MENFKSLFLCTRCHEILSFLPKKHIFQEGNHASRWFITSRIALAFLYNSRVTYQYSGLNHMSPMNPLPPSRKYLCVFDDLFLSLSYSHNNREPGWFDFFHELWRQMALAYQQEVGYWVHELSNKGTVKIASVLLRHFKPENIALEVDSDKVILHGKHRSEREDGFYKCEFKRVFPLPQNVDPTTVTSRTTQDGGVLVIEGLKRVEEKEDEGKFETKLDVSGFKPEEIKIQLHGK